MVFDAFRLYGGPTQHPDSKHPVTADVLEAGFIFAFCLLAVCFFVILPGYRGVQRFFVFTKVLITLFIGICIFLGVIGQDWMDGEIESKTPYKAFTKTEITASIGIKIGLGSVNVTLKGHPVDQVVQESHGNNTLHWKERIDYNERFHWTWRQGRFGFGPYSGEIAQELRAAQYKGLPLPILWIAEYFAVDGELIRWGRSFRTAGWFTWQVLWAAVPFWLLANVMSFQVLFYAGCLFMLTGITMIVSVVIYASIRWGTQPLFIPFEDDTLTLHYGFSFWLTIAGGLTSLIYGVIITLMDIYAPQAIAHFFNLDVLYDKEEFYHQQDSVTDGTDHGIERKMATTVRGAQKRIRNISFAPGSMRVRATARRKRRSNAPQRSLHFEEAAPETSTYEMAKQISSV